MQFDKGSSHHFVMSLILFADEEHASRVDRRIAALRQELGLPSRYEFKFTSMNRERRLQFLDTCASYEFSYYTAIVEKRRLNVSEFPDRESLYIYTADRVVGIAGSNLQAAKIVVDRLGGRGLRAGLDRELRRKVCESGGGVRDVVMQDSSRQNLLQLADMIVGAMARTLGDTGDAHAYYRAIKRREAQTERWP